PQAGMDHSAARELWVDYLSDTGDGWHATYTMAWLLAQESLDFDGEALPRAKVLLLGGDQVYPAADPVAYENRFIGPYAAALPKTNATDLPELYALPGNHDWYDGLVSFLRVFCARGGRIGNWATRQRRSYFAIKLPNGWWIWGIDIQLDTYIDDVQLDYFRALPVKPGDKIVLLTAKPAWIKALPARVDPASWRYLSYFEERVVRAGGGRLVMTITGDLHHYARYEPRDDPDAPTRVTAGGGGAYLSGTHTLYRALSVRSLDHTEAESVAYDRAQVYPRPADSSRLANGILKLARLNPSFARLLGGLYVLLGLAMLGALNSGIGDLYPTATAGGFDGFLSAGVGGMTLVVVALMFVGLFGGTDIVPRPLEPSANVVRLTKLARLAVALLHTALHLAIVALVLWAAVKIAGDHPLLIWALGLGGLFLAGTVLGATLFGAVLLAVHRVRGEQAWEAANQVFTGQSIPDYKNLLRMRFGADGGLTVYPLGVDRVGRDWRFGGWDGTGPRFAPGGPPPVVHPIDDPLRFDAAGRRLP
ncbi:MAG TPA: metallophosphoesterase, partial [Solirubrobacteraceae bacterium]|nr:metallophosphoesterase [Solirubrobacteraceae bacterium]